VLAGLLIVGAITLYLTNYKEVREIDIFAVVLLVQSLPFIAAVVLAAIERTPLNDFATWRAVEARFAELLPKRSRTMAKVAAPAPKPPELVP
jgi:hypothetical protein